MKKNICKKLNWLTAILSILVLFVSIFNTVTIFIGSISNAEDAVVVEAPVEMLERLNLQYSWLNDASLASRPNVEITRENDGSYGQTAVLQAINIIATELDIARNKTESYAKNGYALETFGSFTCKVPIGKTVVSVTEATYQLKENDGFGNYYASNCLAQVTKETIGFNIADQTQYIAETDTRSKHYTNDGVVYDRKTKRIVGDYSRHDIYPGTTDVPDLECFEIELDKLDLASCSLSRDVNTYKLDLVYKKGLGNHSRRSFLEDQEVIGNVNVAKCTASIYFNIKGTIGYMTKYTDVSIILDATSVFPALGTFKAKTILFEATTFNYFPHGRKAKTFV